MATHSNRPSLRVPFSPIPSAGTHRAAHPVPAKRRLLRLVGASMLVLLALLPAMVVGAPSGAAASSGPARVGQPPGAAGWGQPLASHVAAPDRLHPRVSTAGLGPLERT